MNLRREERACGGSDQCPIPEPLQKTTAFAAGGLASWLGRVRMSYFSHLISCAILE
jgi:hypothetical protein